MIRLLVTENEDFTLSFDEAWSVPLPHQRDRSTVVKVPDEIYAGWCDAMKRWNEVQDEMDSYLRMALSP